MTTDDADLPELPEDATAALRRAFGGGALDAEKARALDAAVLDAAARRIGRPQPRPRLLPRVVAGLVAAAAAVLLLAWPLWRSAVRPGTEAGAELVEAGGADLDGSGRVDVLDAFLLARRLERGDAPGRYDLDGDGAVGAGDVELVMREAVRLR